jgi:hypothetical protein
MQHALLRSALVTVFTAMLALAAVAQNTIRVRGTIERVEGRTLLVKDRDGADLRIELTDDAQVLGLEKASIADIKPGAFVGAAAMRVAGGGLMALEVHIFPEHMRGIGEGHRENYDLKPGSSMTNGAVMDAVVEPDGRTLRVQYKGGEQKITVTPQTPVVTYVPATVADLKSGAKIVVFRAMKRPDGTIEAARVNVGMNGLMPPM